jgi:hypothetical protein
MFKLVIFEPRSCRCGHVRGHLQNNQLALVNGKGISISLDNRSLVESGNKLQRLPQNKNEEYYAKQTPLICHVRPQSGTGNPRSKINHQLDSSNDIAIMLEHAVKQYRQEHSTQSATPDWVTNAERVLKNRKSLPAFNNK